MTGRVTPLEMDTQEYDLENAEELIPKGRPRFPRVAIHQLFRFAKPIELLMIIGAALSSIAYGSVNLLAIKAVGQSLISLMAGTAIAGGALGKQAPTLLGLGILAFSAKYLSRALWIISAERQVKRVSLMFLESVLRQDMEWFDLSSGESLSTRLSNDVPLIRTGIAESTDYLLSVVGTIITSLIISFWSDWKLTAIILALMPLLIACGAFTVRINAHMAQRTGDAFSQASSIAEQALAGIRTVYAFSLQKRFADLYEEKLNEVELADVSRASLSGLFAGAFNCLLFLIFGLAFYLGSHMVLDGKIYAGDAVVSARNYQLPK
ncbi:ABC transporter type 1, transmembrane domain-containing protein [Powellomyces hirtus]|nr:ABC transporter type 1, transmembrane domain-containing protein [Powellomyces hirtus]